MTIFLEDRPIDSLYAVELDVDIEAVGILVFAWVEAVLRGQAGLHVPLWLFLLRHFFGTAPLHDWIAELLWVEAQLEHFTLAILTADDEVEPAAPQATPLRRDDANDLGLERIDRNALDIVVIFSHVQAGREAFAAFVLPPLLVFGVPQVLDPEFFDELEDVGALLPQDLLDCVRRLLHWQVELHEKVVVPTVCPVFDEAER